MATQVRVGGAWQTLTGCQIYAVGAWRTILRVVVYASGAWREVANFSPPPPPSGGTPPPMSLSVLPSLQSMSGSTSNITSGYVTATPSGGTAPYTYSWTISFADGSSSITSPASAITTFSASALAFGDTIHPEYTCTATDSLGATASATCSVVFSRS